jgi:hypothetical protein
MKRRDRGQSELIRGASYGVEGQRARSAEGQIANGLTAEILRCAQDDGLRGVGGDTGRNEAKNRLD